MFNGLSKASLVTIVVLVMLAIATICGDILTEQTVNRVRSEGLYANATVTGTINFKFSPVTSTVEYNTAEGKKISTKLIAGQLSDEITIAVFYDPQDPTIVTLASGGRNHVHLILTFALLVVCFFVFVLGVENLPSRY